MSGLRIAFDVSQTGRRKAGCGFYAAALIDGLLNISHDHHFTLLTSFGDFYHDPGQVIAFPHLLRRVGYGPRLLTRHDAARFWNNQRLVMKRVSRYDIVHSNNFWCPPYPIPSALIYTIYDMSFVDHPQWTTAKNREGCLTGVENAAIRADGLIAISHATKLSFLKHFPFVPENRIRVIHPASRFSQACLKVKPRPPQGKLFESGQPFLLCVGTIEPRKNHTFLLDIYQRYRNRGGEPIPLVLAGGQGWLMDDFKRLIDSSAWASDIIMLGYVTDAEILWLYENCRVNLYPSLYEGFGLPVLEGMALGAPVICSATTSMPEIVGDAGITLPPNDCDAWVDALSILVSDTQKRNEFSLLGKDRAALFDWQHAASQLLGMYQEVSDWKRKSQ